VTLWLLRFAGKEWRTWKSVMAGDNNVAMNATVKDILYNEAFNNFAVVGAREVYMRPINI